MFKTAIVGLIAYAMYYGVTIYKPDNAACHEKNALLVSGYFCQQPKE
jgi:hypothetical protein